MQSWLILGGAIVAEVVGTTCLKMSNGLTRPWPIAGMVVFYCVSFAGLALALKTIDMSIAYAIWAGLGIALITLIGVYVYSEPLTAWRSICIVLILLGVIGLNLSHR
ncbi:MAG: multidrug efflux SMR transporter [Salinisphaera sp.]|jgi:small multidrug resistance pump|nr:multidrug efflux SMR transporter [Salinisphaera sp.]